MPTLDESISIPICQANTETNSLTSSPCTVLLSANVSDSQILSPVQCVSTPQIINGNQIQSNAIESHEQEHCKFLNSILSISNSKLRLVIKSTVKNEGRNSVVAIKGMRNKEWRFSVMLWMPFSKELSLTNRFT